MSRTAKTSAAFSVSWSTICCKICCKICRGGDSQARLKTADTDRLPLKWHQPPNCHCEEAVGRRGALSAKREEVPLGCNLGKAVAFSPGLSCYPPRYCEIATAPLGPRNDSPGSLMPLNPCRKYWQPAWRSLPARGTPHPYGGKAANGCAVSAATNAIGAYHFNDSLYWLQVRRREGHAPPLQFYLSGFSSLSGTGA